MTSSSSLLLGKKPSIHGAKKKCERNERLLTAAAARRLCCGERVSERTVIPGSIENEHGAMERVSEATTNTKSFVSQAIDFCAIARLQYLEARLRDCQS